jgi:hypothetical protein
MQHKNRIKKEMTTQERDIILRARHCIITSHQTKSTYCGAILCNYNQITSFFFPAAQQALVDQVLLITEASRSHSDTPHSVELLWTSDQPDAEIST